ncbi:hypothetical protein M378DRAFT_24773 [Amanita muscaria Koide BX008]|uniref:Translation machinery-associated protein 22 n=1 Tax=Amanita muscaria (strain Koide BX008) TaxID=946122 RepID=A0A0C2SLI6_AMAMK|nr:hypothetical protein M378DRAFT_24773 [Amanita muscaria Koide BX008]
MVRKNNQDQKGQPTPAAPAPSTTEPTEPAEPIPEPKPPVQVFYCAVCTFPVEYCEFGSSLSKCKEWLKDVRVDLYERFYSEDALQAKIGTMSLEAQSKLEKDAVEKEAKADAKADAALKKKLASQITIKRIERNKRKHVTAIHGLEAFGVDLKKAAKQFASKFATGASVTKNAQGLEEIVVQGDVGDEVFELIEKQVGVLKGIPPDNVEFVEDKKKKSEGA